MENLDINFINDNIKNEEDIKNCTFDSIHGIIDNSNEIDFKNCKFRERIPQWNRQSLTVNLRRSERPSSNKFFHA